jgi:hypothetical protein
MKPVFETKRKETMSSKTENKPVEKIRVGSVQVSIFRNESEKGPYYKGVLEHSYKDADGKWQTSNSFGRRELINLAKAAMLADSKIGELTYRDSEDADEDHDEAAAA